MTGPDDPNWRWEFRCEDFVYARLAEDDRRADQVMLPGPAQDQELNRIDSLYLIANEHNIWVDNRGRSASRCRTCKPSDGGVPCLTMTGLARLWRHHPDYRPAWNQVVDQPERGSGATHREYKKRTTLWTRREAELNAFYSRFDLIPVTAGGECWKCRTCGVQGEEQRDPIALRFAHAITDATQQHPACPSTPKEAP